VIRNIEPTPTPEQVKAKQEEAERKKEAERAAAEQKRKDLALLSSYSAEREFDVARDRNIEPLTGRIRNSNERMKVLDKRLKEIDEEMEFYKAGKSKAGKTREAPPPLVHEQQRVKTERDRWRSRSPRSEKEIEVLKVKFDTDKKRWVDLKADPNMRNKQPDAPTATITMSPAPRERPSAPTRCTSARPGRPTRAATPARASTASTASSSASNS
jgi:hypothetical protein